MEKQIIYKCFISSPGDCQKEREAALNVIKDINNSIANHFRISLRTFMWEDDVLPDMGKNGQKIIDEYIKKSDYDIFIGIMKNKFGTPTKKAGSGTEHEFKDALQRKKNNEKLPRILFFFGKENVDIDDPNINEIIEQRKKVKEFRLSIKDSGIYISFKNINDFKSQLRNKLELFIKEYSTLDKPDEKIKEIDIVLKKLNDDLNEALKTYNEKSPIWIDPIISSKKEIPDNPTKNKEHRVELNSIINNPSDIVIKAPSEFGLTSLAHFMKLEAWKKGKTFLYIDSKKTKKHKIVKDIKKEAENYFFKSISDIDCILLDSVCFEEKGIMQMIKNICYSFENTPLIIFNTQDNNFFIKSDEDDKVKIKRNFTSYYLLPLPQEDIRKVVSSYSEIKIFEDDKDVLLSKVTKDLEILNMHRTVKNCISILRASSKIGQSYSPVNRTKLLEIILNTIFEEYEIPTYHDKKPDVKDVSFVLGYFTELLVLRNDFEFSEDYFINKLNEFCKNNYLELDLKYLLSVLIDNSIIGIKNYNMLYFKNTYWVFYFIAQRMNISSEFLNNIYKNKKYIDFPEIIEFYTGIDRNKEDALAILKSDLSETIQVVRNKVNIPNNINPYKAITWNPDIKMLEKEEEKIGKNVISSGLPDEVKDKYDDKQYNQIRPYYQVINSVIRDYSFLVLMRQIAATSKALRNSDFVKASIKKELLDLIIHSWNEVNKLLIVLSPLLADRGNVTFEGASFILDEDDFRIDDSFKKRMAVLLSIPTNVVKFFKDDLFSSKMGPLLIDKAKNENNSLLKHELMILLIAERPKGWAKVIDDYIVKLDKNSYFLSDVLLTLNFNPIHAIGIEKSGGIFSILSKTFSKKCLRLPDPDNFSILFLPLFIT